MYRDGLPACRQSACTNLVRHRATTLIRHNVVLTAALCHHAIYYITLHTHLVFCSTSALSGFFLTLQLSYSSLGQS